MPIQKKIGKFDMATIAEITTIATSIHLLWLTLKMA